MELYKKYGPVKEFYDFYLNPKENEVLEKYKEIINNEFFPLRGQLKLRFSETKKSYL